MKRTTRTSAVALTLSAALAGCSASHLSPPAQPEPAPVETTDAEIGVVTAVVDGDTIDVATDVDEYRVRIIGIDTPEIGRGGAVDECYAQEARDYLNGLVYDQDVQLLIDPSQDVRDRYDRELRHVLFDGQSVAEAMIANGYGEEYTYRVPYEGADQFQAAEQAAQDARFGLWGECR